MDSLNGGLGHPHFLTKAVEARGIAPSTGLHPLLQTGLNLTCPLVTDRRRGVTAGLVPSMTIPSTAGWQMAAAAQTATSPIQREESEPDAAACQPAARTLQGESYGRVAKRETRTCVTGAVRS